MIRHRTKKQVRFFDLFKLITTVILLLIILYTWRSCSPETAGIASSESAATPAASGAEQVQATETEPAAQPAAQAEATATPSPPPATPTPEPPPATETPTVAAEAEVPTVVAPALTLPPGEPPAGEVTLSGTGAPDSEVEIVVDGQAVSTATVGSDGTWQTTVDLPEAGEYEVQVRAVDDTGAALAESEAATLMLAPGEAEPTAETETTAEAEIITPTLTTSTGSLAAGEVSLSGAGEPGGEVAIVVDGQTVSTATVGSDGTWQTTVDLPDAGEYEVQVQAIDSTGATLAESEPTTLQLEAAETGTAAEGEATAPTLTLPAGELAAGEVALSGVGEPGSTVEIVVDGQAVSTATVGSDGNWQTTVELPDAGDYEVQVQAVDDTGAALAASEPETLTIAASGAATEGEAGVISPTLTMPAGELAAGQVELTGTGEPGSTLEIVIDGQMVSTATVGSDGSWQTTVELPDTGEYEVQVRAVDESGASLGESLPTTLQVGTAEAETPAEGDVAAPTLTMATGALAVGQVQLTGTGEPGSTVEIIIDGQTVSTATVGSDGSWQTTADLPDAGEYEVQLRAVDDTGAALAESSPTTLRVGAAGAGTAAEGDLAAPTLITPTGVLTAGQVQLTGTGEPGSTVEIIIDGQAVSTATVGSDGSWQTTADLPDAGDYEVQVRTVDDTGAALATSEPATLQVGTAETGTAAEGDLAAPTLITPTGVLTVGQVQLSGTGEPGSDLEILIDGQVVSTATVGSDGSWQTAVELPDAGQYEVEVQAVDDTGAALAASQPATLQIGEAGAEMTPAGDQGQAYIVQTDDWLSKIADKFYGDMFAYQAIIDATNAKVAEDSSFIPITDPNQIEVGQKLWIPASP